MSQTSVNVDDNGDKKQNQYGLASMTSMPTRVSLGTSPEIGSLTQIRLSEPNGKISLDRLKHKYQHAENQKLRDIEQTTSIDDLSTRYQDQEALRHRRGLSFQDQLPYTPAYQTVDYVGPPMTNMPMFYMLPQQLMPQQQIMPQQYQQQQMMQYPYMLPPQQNMMDQQLYQQPMLNQPMMNLPMMNQPPMMNQYMLDQKMLPYPMMDQLMMNQSLMMNQPMMMNQQAPPMMMNQPPMNQQPVLVNEAMLSQSLSDQSLVQPMMNQLMLINQQLDQPSTSKSIIDKSLFPPNSTIITSDFGGSVVNYQNQPKSTIFEQKVYTLGNVIYKMPSFTKIY